MIPARFFGVLTLSIATATLMPVANVSAASFVVSAPTKRSLHKFSVPMPLHTISLPSLPSSDLYPVHLPSRTTIAVAMSDSDEQVDTNVSNEFDVDEESADAAAAAAAAAAEILLPNKEKAWRYAKKPLLRIGSKGATPKHGNSLRQLLEQHTVVKVKINTTKLGSLEDAFDVLKKLTEESPGAESGIELIHLRPSENTVMFGQPGTLELIEKGEFPPPVPLAPPAEE